MPRSLTIVRSLTTIGCGLALSLAAGQASAQCNIVKLMHADRQAGDFLGSSMSLSAGTSGPLCAVGMGADNTASGTDAGSVRFFIKINNTWGEANWLTLEAGDAQPSDYFGTSVSYRDPYLIVGATGVGNTGAAYIYQRIGSEWVQESRIITPGAVTGDDAGRAVAVSGNWAMVGAPLVDFDGSPNSGISDPNSGAVFFYKRQANGTWAHTQTQRDAAAGVLAYIADGDQLGSAVDMSGDVAVIGIPYGESINWPNDHGYIHILRRDGADQWVNDASIWYVAPGSIQADDHYGYAVSTDGTSIAIGAPDDDAAPGDVDTGSSAKVDSGAVYFQRFIAGAWTTDGRVIPPDAVDNGRFGTSVSIKNGRCVIGAAGSKKAYVYERRGAADWVLISTIQDNDGPDGFASSVAFDGTYALVGDEIDNENNLTTGGAVYIYQPTTAYGDSCDAAISISNGSHFGCTTYAQADTTTTCGGGGAGYGPDVWYSFTPTCSGTYVIDTEGSAYDTVLSVHSDCPGNGGSNTLMCDDDGGTGTLSRIAMNFSSGTTYLIRVSGYNLHSGEFMLNITSTLEVPSNDLCTSPTAMSVNSLTLFQNCTATTDAALTSCVAQMSKDVWFRFTAPMAPGLLQLSTAGSNFDTVMSLYNVGTCPTNADMVACDDDSGIGFDSLITTNVVAGQQYMVRVGTFSSITTPGEGILTIGFDATCDCDWNLSGTLTVQDIFDFLTSYFAGSADINHSATTTVQDIFDFLDCYFSGCI